MADGQSIFGVDTARYQPLGTYDRGAFEIVNVEDPQLAAKVAACVTAGAPWGAYLWVYPGHDLFADAQWAADKIRGLGHGDPPVGLWADYEDAGISPDQLHAFFAGVDAKGMKAGYYSGPFALDHSGFLDRPWWNAAYPTGAVDFPGYGSLWASSRPRPMHLWQYTSAGGLDRDVVVDEAWWADFTGSTPAPAPTPHQESNMLIGLESTHDAQNPNAYNAFLVDGGVIVHKFTGPYAPWGLVLTAQDAQDFAGSASVHPFVFDDQEWADIRARTEATKSAAGGGAVALDTNAVVSAVLDGLAARLKS